ncbi:capsid protein [Euphorbia heterophylla associated gemycircularvirus]|uniref:Capsid protein n=1 Tax=Euphorbia heterophylla associated gemycircularvirus TaxID=2291614 RepID=A0A345S7V0_9VIRU|nr:capsid protein [Euphorbia heterophylla associated gemycircularvirus]AXI69779.1 capsid protein [Euphorbia heterophylla associated gemycircularvirus]
MPYRRKARKPARNRRYGGVRRRYPIKKTQFRKRRMTPRKRILNIASRKKRDNMIANTNITISPKPGTFASGGAVLTGDRQYIIPWVASGRPLNGSDNTNNTIAEAAARTATECYMRGLNEKIQIQTSTAQPWQWRRVCFQYRQRDILNTQNADTPLVAQTAAVGLTRGLVDALQNGTMAQTLLNVLFQGRQSIDWASFFTAKVDNRNVTLCYDRTRIINSGNNNGIIRNYKIWHPMNKTLRYGDDETGNDETSSFFCSASNYGMGDYYIVDIFSAGPSGTSNDQLKFEPEATLYWHER